MTEIMKSVRHIVRSNILNISYLTGCLLLSLPFFSGVLTITNSHELLPGHDTSVHAIFIQRILETGNPLIEYSPFSDLRDQEVNMYYPSLMHNLLSTVIYMLGFTSPMQIIVALKTFIILVSITGAVGFSLLVKEILKISMFHSYRININEFGFKFKIYFMLLSLLAFGILIFSSSLLLKTINDGTYAQMFAMWAIFPFYLIFLVRNNWIKSGILLAIIGSTHNLSLIMTLAVTISYLSSFLISRKWNMLKKSLIFFITFGVLSIPSFILFYFPTIQGVAEGNTGNLELLSQDAIRLLLSPAIYYLAIPVSFILIILSYKRLSWLSIWIAINFTLMSFFPIVSARVVRESSIAFSMIMGVCLAYSISLILSSNNFKKFIKNRSHLKGHDLRIVLVLAVIVIIFPIYLDTQYGKLLSESNPFITYYHSDVQDEAYQYLASSYNNRYGNNTLDIKENIILYGTDAWLKVLLYEQYNIYESLDRFSGSQLNSKDKEINDDFLSIIKNPASPSSACLLKKYDISYLYIADNLPQRFYSEHQIAVFYEELNLFRFFTSPFLQSEKIFHGNDEELIQIYSVNEQFVDNYC
jgi:hypothetical protein